MEYADLSWTEDLLLTESKVGGARCHAELQGREACRGRKLPMIAFPPCHRNGASPAGFVVNRLQRESLQKHAP